MSGIEISAELVEERFVKQLDLVDQLDVVLNGFPDPVDGGAATMYITSLFQTAVEAHGNLADTHRALIGVARDVIRDFAHDDSAAADEIRDLKSEIDNPQ